MLTVMKGGKKTWKDEAKAMIDAMSTPGNEKADILILVVAEDGATETLHTMPTMMAAFHLEHARLLLQGVVLNATERKTGG